MPHRPNAGDRPTVVVAGAGGFVGRALLSHLVERYDVVGTSRAPKCEVDAQGVRWRAADLYSLLQAERALEGAKYAVYLVHSMMPNARLTQARFEDLDLILADNFGRAAARAGVEQIVYLGGLLPEGQERSRHLESRREVEDALGAHGVPVTAIRAGLVVGPGGSSLEILTALVKRLPMMLTPEWTATRTQPIALRDLLRAIEHAIGNERFFDQAVDVGGPDVLTYREMMEQTSEVLGLRRPMFPVPFLTPRLSTAWVCMVTGAPRQLVGPLVESLRHEMIARDDRLLGDIGGPTVPFDDAVAEALAARPSASSTKAPKQARTVRSVQRLPVPKGWTAMQVAERYAEWVPRFFRPFLSVHRHDDKLLFRLRGIERPLLELTYAPERSSDDRALFYVTGGLLRRRHDGDGLPGRLEFRLVNGGTEVLAAVHDFRPSLPWMIYSNTQALVHLWVMHAFGGALRRETVTSP